MRSVMSFVRCGAVFLAGMVGLVAADTAAHAQQNNNDSSYNWNGFYGGANSGFVWGGSDVLSISPNGAPFIEGVLYPAFPATSGIAAVIAAYRSNTLNTHSFIGGLQAGYNVRSGNWVFGFESDISYLNMKASKTTSAFGVVQTSNGNTFPPTLYTFHNELDANYLFTARSRLGALMGGGMLYATGGLAVTTLNYGHSLRATGGLFDGLFENASASEAKAGWTIGGGYELPISANTTLKAEYLFVDFGSTVTNGNKIFPGPLTPIPDVACHAETFFFGPTSPAPRQCLNHKADLLLQIVRLGVNFKF